MAGSAGYIRQTVPLHVSYDTCSRSSWINTCPPNSNTVIGVAIAQVILRCGDSRVRLCATSEVP